MLPKRAIKILLNLAFIANEALVRGGTLSIAAENRGDEQEIVISGRGPKIVIDSAVREALAGNLQESDIDSRTAAAWMVRNLAVRGGGLVQLAQPDAEQLIIGAVVKGDRV
jgi:histidine phosphotransferase ChpT